MRKLQVEQARLQRVGDPTLGFEHGFALEGQPGLIGDGLQQPEIVDVEGVCLYEPVADDAPHPADSSEGDEADNLMAERLEPPGDHGELLLRPAPIHDHCGLVPQCPPMGPGVVVGEVGQRLGGGPVSR